MLISKSANASEEEKLTALRVQTEHLQVKKQRKCVACAKEADSVKSQSERNSESFRVFSFDFAESLKFPRSPLQVGSSYFQSLRTAEVFGIHNEGTGVQHNFLVDEAQTIGKGANAIVLFADNCVGRNKNNGLLQYLQGRVLTGLNKEIHYDFLIVGHKKFSPDRSFGVVKKNTSKAFVDLVQAE